MGHLNDDFDRYNQNMRFGKITFILIFLLLGLLLILIFTNIPNSRLLHEIKINRGQADHYLLKLDLPEQIWYSRAEKVQLQLKNEIIQPELNPQNQEIANIEAGKIQNLEVDFVLTGAELNPPGVSIIPILDEKTIMMNWKIKPLIDQDIQGSVWVYINTIHNGRENENQRELIFTRDITIKNKMMLGLKIGTFQWILITLIIVILLLLSLSSRKSRFNDIKK